MVPVFPKAIEMKTKIKQTGPSQTSKLSYIEGNHKWKQQQQQKKHTYRRRENNCKFCDQQRINLQNTHTGHTTQQQKPTQSQNGEKT